MAGNSLRALVLALLWIGAPSLAGAETVTFEEETEPYPGVRLIERHTSSPSWRIHAAAIELCHQGVHVEARSSQSVHRSAAGWGEAMGAQLAVNGDFYRTDRSAPTVYGDAVGVGQRWPALRTGLAPEFEDDWYYRKYGWIAVGDDWVELSHSRWVKEHAAELGVTQGFWPTELTTEIPPGTRALVSGFPELVVEGTALEEFPDRSDMAVRHPRTAMGLSRDRRTFFLVVVDGRSTASVGMTGAELAELMRELGAWTAFNLDGGGSSQMWLSGAGTINAPSDGSPRPVANHWGVFAGEDHERGAAPGSCFTAGGCFPSPIPEAAGSRFADLPDGAANAGAASLVVDEQLLSACAERTREMFCPSCPLTRREAVAMLVRAAEIDLDTPPAAPTFSDVPVDDPAYAEIEAAAELGVTSGCAEGRFCPDEPVTRAALAAFLARVRGWGAPAEPEESFSDVPRDHPLHSEIHAVTARCVEAACGGGAFCPQASVGRAAGAEIAVQGFNLDGENPCAEESPGDAGPGGSRPPGEGAPGGCRAAGAAGGWSWTLILALVLVCRRR